MGDYARLQLLSLCGSFGAGKWIEPAKITKGLKKKKRFFSGGIKSGLSCHHPVSLSLHFAWTEVLRGE
jgi:hypothetical protein